MRVVRPAARSSYQPVHAGAYGGWSRGCVQGGHLILKPLTLIPAMRRGFRLYPADPEDPYVFRIYFPEFGMNLRVVFQGEGEGGAPRRLLLDTTLFEKRADIRNPRPWLTGGLAVGAGALAIRGLRHYRDSGGAYSRIDCSTR